MMTQLTDTQLVLLSAASQRADGMVPIHERLKGGVAKAVGKKLIALGLAEERVMVSAAAVWRQNGDGERFGLFITERGLTAIGAEDGMTVTAGEAEQTSGEGRRVAAPPQLLGALPENRNLAAPARKQAVLPADCSEPSCNTRARPGTKKALVIGLLACGDGASVDEIMAQTGWQAHTIRAALTGLRKAGVPVATAREVGCVTRYRISGADAATGHDLGAAGPIVATAEVGAGA